MKTKVIFRTWRDTGEVIAIFPEVPADVLGNFASSYMHTGPRNPHPRATMNPPPCHHAAGYWIRRGESFRCYCCGHQFRLSEIAPRRRRIETWKTK